MTLPYILIAVILLGELPTMGQTRAGSRGRDHGSYAVILFLMTAGYWGAFYFAQMPGPRFGPWSAWLGAVLTVCGTAFRQWAILTLGQYFTRSVQVSSDQRVVQEGPYRWVRHPSYTGALMAATGVGLALGGALSVGCLLLAMLPAFAYRIRVEESALDEALGEPYRVYCARTKRLIPFVW